MIDIKTVPDRRGGRSTAVVLWLMILVVFVPIATLHGIARALEPEPQQVARLR